MKRSAPFRSDPAKVREWRDRSHAKAKRWRPKAAGMESWLLVAGACKERDGARCRRCGRDTGVILDAAHVVSLRSGASRYKESDPRNALANLVTLCRRCHADHDERHAWRWADIGVEVDAELAARYGYREHGAR